MPRSKKRRGTADGMTSLDQLSSLSLDALEDRISSLLRTERLTAADIVISLAELHRRRGDEALGFSLWTYCHEKHRMPERSATRYSRLAMLVVRFPAAAEFLRDGRLNPSTLRMLEDHLTPENHLDLFNRASGLTMKEVEHLLVVLKP